MILTEQDNFPTDLYIAQGIARLLPDVEVRASIAPSWSAALSDEVAVLMLTQVDYRSGERHDMARAVRRRARGRGAQPVGPVAQRGGDRRSQLNACGADLAVGCGYKYLNGGPGAPAFLYVAAALQDRLPFAADRLDGPRCAVRLRRRLSPRAGDRALPRRAPRRLSAWRRSRRASRPSTGWAWPRSRPRRRR